jgi:hypothetical protein
MRDARDGRFVLTLWTDDPLLAGRADAAGVDRIGLDLEVLGKEDRQKGLGTWISPHRPESLPKLRQSLRRAELFARVNPLGATTKAEVDRVVAEGVQVLMLPMVETVSEVARFVELVAGRAKVVALLETRAAAENAEGIVRTEGVDEVHVGINDLALSLGLRNRFRVLDSEHVARISECARSAGKRLGLGGLGRVDDQSLPIPSDLVYAQLVRLGATAALLSRTYLRRQATPDVLRADVSRTRRQLDRWRRASPAALESAHRRFQAAVAACEVW